MPIQVIDANGARKTTHSGLAIAAGKTLTVQESLILAGVAGKTLTLTDSLTVQGGGATTLISAGNYALTLQESMQAAGRNVANTFSAAQNFGTGATGGQVAVKAASASTVGLVVDSAATPTANIFQVRANGVSKFTVGPTGAMSLEILDGGGGVAAAATLTSTEVLEAGGIFLVSARTASGTNAPQVGGMWIVSREGTGTNVVIVAAPSYFTLSVNGSFQVVITNASASTRYGHFNILRLI